MTKEALKEQIERVPFQPFTIRLTDGRTYGIAGRDYVFLAPNGRTMIVVPKENEDLMKWVDVGLITEIEAPANY